MTVRVVPAGPGDLADVFRIRHAVFVEEQGVPVELERDSLDATAEHFLAVAGGGPVSTGGPVGTGGPVRTGGPIGTGGPVGTGGPIGTVRLVVETAGPFAGLAHLGRLAVLAPARGAGVGAALTRAVERRATERGLPEVVLAAQVDAMGFYSRLGYAAEGPVFDDAGIPHRLMRRRLR